GEEGRGAAREGCAGPARFARRVTSAGVREHPHRRAANRLHRFRLRLRPVRPLLLVTDAMQAEQTVTTVMVVLTVMVPLYAVRLGILALAVVADQMVAAVVVVLAVVVDLLAMLAALVLVAAE